MYRIMNIIIKSASNTLIIRVTNVLDDTGKMINRNLQKYNNLCYAIPILVNLLVENIRMKTI